MVCVTLLSIMAMALYPALAAPAGWSDDTAGVFLGATIHNVAQVIGAGYMVSPAVGDTAVLTKLLQVALLVPVVFAIAVLTGRRAVARAPPGVPGFLVGFVVQATLGLAGQLPDWLADAGFGLARALLLTAVAATGLRTEVRDFQTVGRSAMLLVAGETVFLARAAASLLTLCFPG